MSDHAKLSASGSKTWLYCAASPRISADLPDESSPFAEEGTRAHENAAAQLLKQPMPHADGREIDLYIEFVRELMA